MKEAVRKALREAIKDSGLTHFQVATSLGMPQSEFSRRINSERSFTPDALMQICKIINKSVDEIYTRARQIEEGAA